MSLLDADGLARLESAVGRALEGEAPDDPTGALTVLGHGEITLVLGWPSDAPAVAAKRLPPFPDRSRAERYGQVVLEYIDELSTRGLHCVESEFLITETTGGWAAYVVQPLLGPTTLGPAVLRSLDMGDPGGRVGRELLDRVTDAVVGATDERVGVDGQLSNWADTPDGLRYFDVTTPILRDDSGRTRLDLRTLTSPLPAPLRPLVRRFVAPAITAKYHDPRVVLLDLAANLYKERLEHWVDATIVSANRHLSSPITPAQARDYYRSDARTWELMFRLRTADRWWHQKVLRRPYGSLLPLGVDR